MREWLRAIRKEKKMTMAAVAKKAQISQTYYSDIEHNRYANGENRRKGNSIPVHTAKKIANALGFPWEMFYSSDDTNE